MTDPIADMLTRIRNAMFVKKTDIILPYSKTKFNIAKILEKEKKIKKAEMVDNILNKEMEDSNFKQIKIVLKYNNSKPSMTSIKRISKPGQRIYVAKNKIPSILGGLGLVILSTSYGFMTGKDARKKGVGGELICEIW